MANRSVNRRTWYPTSAPQTLQFAVALLYWNAAIALLLGFFTGGLGRLGLVLILGDVAGGYGVSNEKKWGYWTAIVTAALSLLLVVAGFGPGSVIALLFAALLVVLLVHPMSRGYYKLWFR